MEFSGLIQKYKVNRPLSDEERQMQLTQTQRLDVAPGHVLAVTRLNSTYLETVDKYYGWKGFLSAVMLALLVIFGGGYIAIVRVLIFQKYLDSGYWNQSGALQAFVLASVLILPLIAVAIWLLLKESFCYTHYPIRLNRKNRRLYVFRMDGSVLSTPWDEVYFAFGRGMRSGVWDIRGHILDGDRQTVKETFALGMTWTELEGLRQFWEFQRRYMENGPQAIAGKIGYCLPITDRKEPFALGQKRLTLNFAGLPALQLLLFPIFIVLAAGRAFAMRTSKIPHWPQEVEDACRIEPGDPFEQDARNNPPESWLSKIERVG